MATAQPLVSKHYSPQEVAKLIGMSVRTILRWIKAGELPAVRVGRSLRVSDASLRGFLAERRVT